MKNLKFFCWIIFVLCVIFITGCATFRPSKEVFTSKTNLNSRVYDASEETCWLAIKQVILKNNFSIINEDTQLKRIQAAKNFEKGSSSISVSIQVTLLPSEDNKSEVYLNATQTTKKLHVARRTTSLLFIIPVPLGSEASQTQTEKTIDDKKFYKAFFDQIAQEIKALTEN